ncbi:MAG: HAMP domain-containing sensor histidine kinase [Pseudomonadota bacterium]
MNRRAKETVSPVSQLARRLTKMGTLNSSELTELTPPYNSPFSDIDTLNNIEALALKNSLTEYHQTQIEYIIREQRFTAEISHELRTPMSVIKASAQWLELQHPDMPHIKRIIQSVNQMTLISTSLLTIARQQHIDLDDDIRIHTLTKRCVKDVKQSFLDDHKYIDISTPDQNIVIKGHETLVYIILCNLIRNAIQYSQASSLVIHADQSHLTLTDNGVGFPNELLASFQNTDDNNIMPYSPSSEGYGIGMVLVKRLCHIQNWGLRLSNNPSSGATITLSFNHI